MTGLSAIIFYATRIPISYSYFTINLILLLVALKILGLKFMIKTIYAISVLSLLLAFAQWLMTGPDGKMHLVLGEGTAVYVARHRLYDYRNESCHSLSA